MIRTGQLEELVLTAVYRIVISRPFVEPKPTPPKAGIRLGSVLGPHEFGRTEALSSPRICDNRESDISRVPDQEMSHALALG